MPIKPENSRRFQPDKPGGWHERMAAINAAQDLVLQELFT